MTMLIEFITAAGNAVCFLGGIIKTILTGRVRLGLVARQIYEQGVQSVFIIALTSLASGIVLALNGYVMLARFGAKEYVAQLVALSLLRELSPVFTALIFSGKAGARVAAELGTMNVNDQILATRTLGVDSVEFLVVPRFLACLVVLPLLVIFSEIVGIAGGYFIGLQSGVPGAFYINQTLKAIRFIDFFSGVAKAGFFSLLIGWICCYQGFFTRGGSMGVGKFTTKAVAYSYIFVILSDVILTKMILAVWE